MSEPYQFKPLVHVTRTDSELVQRADDFYRLVNQRRTVREFSPKAVPAAVIRSAIAAAGTAPSGAHMQPWHAGTACFVGIQPASWWLARSPQFPYRPLYQATLGDRRSLGSGTGCTGDRG